MNFEMAVLILMGLGVITAAFVYVSDKRNVKLESIRMEKMRNGELYQELNDILRRLRKRYVEQVLIRRECIEFIMLVPAGRRVVFSLASRGYRPLSIQRQRTLCLLLSQDLPVLGDRSRFTLRKAKRPLPNGEVAVEYIYTMRIEYKDALNRAPYYMQN